jgi:uncharacterized protein YkwD
VGDVGSAPSKLGKRKITRTLGTTPSPTRLAVKILLAAINAGRTAHGLAPVSLDTRESRCSRRHSKHMALRGQISHDQFPADVCVPHRYAGENVGFDAQPPTSAVLELHRLMMDEGPCAPIDCTGSVYEQHGHYLNLVNPLYTHVGIGIVSRKGATWLTEDFTT